MENEQIFRIAEIIARHIQGQASLKDGMLLDEWKSADREHRRLLEKFSQYEFWESKQIAEYLCAKEKAYRQFCVRRQLFLRRKKIRMYTYRAMAAVVILLVGFCGFLSYRPEVNTGSVSGTAFLPAGESRAVLTLADGQKVYLGKQAADTLLQNGEIVANNSEACLRYNASALVAESLAYNRLEVPRKGEYMLVLTDGTKVWLNSESQLRYPVNFTGNERRVFLKGEAYFEVSYNEKSPFIVVAGSSAIQVLGTSFNVRAYADEGYSYTTLVEGSVRLSTGKQAIVLKPDEQGISTVSGQLDKRTVDVKLYTGWREGRFVFENQSLEEMMQTLSRWYDVNVFFTGEKVKKAMFTGNLKRYDDFDKIADMLELTGVAHFEIEGNTVIVSE